MPTQACNHSVWMQPHCMDATTLCAYTGIHVCQNLQMMHQANDVVHIAQPVYASPEGLIGIVASPEGLICVIVKSDRDQSWERKGIRKKVAREIAS